MTETAAAHVERILHNPKILITYLWFSILALSSLFCLVMIVMASYNNGDVESDSTSLAFAGIWLMFLTVALAVGGTCVMRTFTTPLAVGFFLGVTLTLSQLMLIFVVLFSGAAHGARKDVSGKGAVHSDEAAATFCFFLFVAYLVFAAVLVKYRHVVIRENNSTESGVNNVNSSNSASDNSNNVTSSSTVPVPNSAANNSITTTKTTVTTSSTSQSMPKNSTDAMEVSSVKLMENKAGTSMAQPPVSV